MCEWCEKYGDGGKWFLNPANYARRLYKVRKEGSDAQGADADPQSAGMGGGAINEIIKARMAGDYEKEKQIKDAALAVAYQRHFGQVVTLEETYQVLDIAYPIVKMTCGCRRAAAGLPDDKNFTCMGVGPGMYKWERWPETYRGGVEFLTPEEGKDWAKMCDELGMVHTIDVFGTPYIGGLCQCEYPGCSAIRNRVDYDFKFLLKGEYVAKVDAEACSGCKRCLTRCNFKALNYKVYLDTAHIDMVKCFGCGLCATECPEDAISLIDRNTLPALKDDW